ncbi:MAG: hypothetical protein IJI39_01030 [Clostridia bacterium]|nr:hypothetical protein [Clostridia bacterium]
MDEYIISDDIVLICISALENSIIHLEEYIKDTKPPKSAMVYRNLQLEKSAKAHLESREGKIRFSELKITHSALENMKEDISDVLVESELTVEEAEELKQLRRDVNRSLSFLRVLAQSIGREIDEYKHNESIDM